MTAPTWLQGVAPDDPARQHGVSLLYSGGSDSTLAACRLAQHFPVVHLITYTRTGFLQQDAPLTHYERMKLRFPEVKFHHHLIEYGKMYEAVESDRRFRFALKYGTMTNVPCGHCKVAMHWRSLLFCQEHGLSYAADGAVTGNEWFAEQNPNILMDELREMYAEFGISLLHPVFEDGLSTEQELYDLGITDQVRIKRTKSDKQIICSQHIMLAMYMRKELDRRPFVEYEQRSRTYLSDKLQRVRELTREHVAKAGTGKLARLRED